jgi:hypothetical protein
MKNLMLLGVGVGLGFLVAHQAARTAKARSSSTRSTRLSPACGASSSTATSSERPSCEPPSQEPTILPAPPAARTNPIHTFFRSAMPRTHA